MAKDRRTHSSIDKLPANLRSTLIRMVVDNDWPADYPGQPNGKPRYEDLVTYCIFKGYSVSESAIGRWAKHTRIQARMKEAGLYARTAMEGLNSEKASATQKAAAEMATALIIDFMVSHDDYTSKQLKEFSQAIRDCATVSITADKHIHEQITKKVEAAAKSTKEKLTKAKVDRKVIQEIIDEHLGVVKS